MDKWTRAQDLIEDVFGRRPETPEILLEYMITMADMIIEAREPDDPLVKTHPEISLRN